jgi:spermidine synthase
VVAWFFGFFLVSGFCALVYQVVWLRLAMAAFGVTTPMVSIVISVFMAGLALGSIGAGRLEKRLAAGGAPAALRAYALAELIIALSGELVPRGLAAGRDVLGASAWGSLGHYVAAGGWVALVLLPFCVAMGATFPLAMSALRSSRRPDAERSFSFLYLANVAGALLGVLTSAFVLIELLGFRGTLRVTASGNLALAVAALALSVSASWGRAADATPAPAAPRAAPSDARGSLAMLFATGLASMGMEVVWVRQYTPYLGTVVYAFATILALYLFATAAGSLLYRRGALAPPSDWTGTWAVVGALGLLPLLLVDPRLQLGWDPLRAALGLMPFCAALGFLTPLLVDRWSQGAPGRAGAAYALNVAGCIVGPLLAAFVLLPRFGARGSLALLAGGLVLLSTGRRLRPSALAAAAVGVGAALVLFTRDFESQFPQREVRRDYTATVTAIGDGMGKSLLVNGVGMTNLTTITKMMAHLPMAARTTPPRNAVVICMGMGTTFRSLLSWNVPVTAVELVPSIPALMPYFHEDAAHVLARDGARIAVDDGRRFLERASGSFDVITIDPPPPVRAAGSSLLYSREFYAAASARLSPDGVLQQWIPLAEPVVAAAMVRAAADSFPYVRVFQSVEGWGTHILASRAPLELPSAAALARRLPRAAAADLAEWTAVPPELLFGLVLAREVPLELAAPAGIEGLADDRPLNEYYLLRSRFGLMPR